MVPALPHGVRVVFLLALLSGCIVGDESASSGGETDVGVTGPNERPIPTNGLVLDVTLAAQLPTGPLVDSALFDTPAGRELVKYVAICALPQDQSLTIGGERFDGFYGLASQWPTAGCDTGCQHWVSACLLAHANQNGTPVPISLRADTSTAFALEAQQLASFTFQEAAFYGNLFQSELYACLGNDSYMGGGDPQKFLDGRVCGFGSCGLVSTGLCASLTQFNDGACAHQPQPGGGYADCHVGAQGETTPRTSATFAEVVTVYLAP